MELKFCIVILQCIMNVQSEIDFLKSWSLTKNEVLFPTDEQFLDIFELKC